MSLNSESIDVGDDREALLPENDDEQSIQAKRRRSSIVLTGGHAYWQVIFVTIPIFMGYACLNALQHKVKHVLEIPDDNSARSHLFGVACSFLYIGNLVFRLMHNIVFSCMKPRARVFLSFACIGTSMLCIAVFIFIIPSTRHLAWVFIAYGLGGVGVGSFESNVMSVITPLGHATKTWAVLGLPIGYNIINIGSFLMMLPAPDNLAIQTAQYFIVMTACVCGAGVFAFTVPQVTMKNNSDTLEHFTHNLKQYRTWFPKVWVNSIALMIDMAAVSMFSGLMLYIWDFDHVPLFGNGSASIPKNAFMAIYNFCTFIGDTASRKTAYYFRPLHPLLYNILTVIGVALCLSKIAALAFPGMFLVMWANGAIYATTTRHVDNTVSDAHHLIAMSCWLFIGDLGSVTGSNLISYVKVWVGKP